MSRLGKLLASATGTITAQREYSRSTASHYPARHSPALAKAALQAHLEKKVETQESYLPEIDEGWSLFGNNYATLDLVIEASPDIALEVKDSSGDAVFRNIAALTLQDSSGDIEIEDASGPVSIQDSSGDIKIERVGDSVSILDSSGDIEVDQVSGNFTIEVDSSGDIRATNIDGSVLVKKDSSGDISVESVGGDFRVLADGSGSIHSHDVQGKIETPRDG